jgi:hypothetical protein
MQQPVRRRKLTGPSSSRRAFSRRAKITVKGTPKGASPAAMAQAPPLTLIFHGKIRRQSGGRTGLDSAFPNVHSKASMRQHAS